jgi:hypothetical protein
MTASLCPNHLRAVTNYFGEPVAFQFQVDAARCVVCRGEIRVEEARRYAAHAVFVARNENEPEQPQAYHD